jgi:hypothetical protein
MTDQWENRIVGQGEVDPNELLANPRNWRLHPKVQQEALEGTIDRIGWIDDIIVNKRTGYVLDGHLRVSLALRRGQELVPVKYIDLSEEEERVALATLDPIAAMAETDVQLLNDVLNQIDIHDGPILEVLTRLSDEVKEKSWQVPSLDDLEQEYGDTEKRHFYPIVRVQIHPKIHAQYMRLINEFEGVDEARKFEAFIDAVVSGWQYGA